MIQWRAEEESARIKGRVEGFEVLSGSDRVKNVRLLQSRCEMNFLRIEADWH